MNYRFLSILLLCISTQALSHAAHNTATYCKQTVGTIEVNNANETTLLLGSLWMDIATNHTQHAQQLLAENLTEKAESLQEQLTKNPCHATAQSINDIYNTLQVLAAINQHKPIQGINNNPAIMAQFKKAISNNPKAYAEKLKRTQHWQP